MDVPIPSREELLKGRFAYEKHEQRDAMYKVATFLICHFWGNYTEMTNGLGVLLLTWNNAFYRYGAFSFESLQTRISQNFDLLTTFRNRDILTLTDEDESAVKSLFEGFLEALQISVNDDGINDRHKRTPVGVAKALHLLAPNFFPIWDEKISKQYGCYYEKYPADKYWLFCKKIRSAAYKIGSYYDLPKESLVKLLDEYNYSKYTKQWI